MGVGMLILSGSEAGVLALAPGPTAAAAAAAAMGAGTGADVLTGVAAPDPGRDSGDGTSVSSGGTGDDVRAGPVCC